MTSQHYMVFAAKFDNKSMYYYKTINDQLNELASNPSFDRIDKTQESKLLKESYENLKEMMLEDSELEMLFSNFQKKQCLIIFIDNTDKHSKQVENYINKNLTNAFIIYTYEVVDISIERLLSLKFKLKLPRLIYVQFILTNITPPYFHIIDRLTEINGSGNCWTTIIKPLYLTEKEESDEYIYSEIYNRFHFNSKSDNHGYHFRLNKIND